MEDPLINALNTRYPTGETTCNCIHAWGDEEVESFAFNKTHHWMTQNWYDFMGSK